MRRGRRKAEGGRQRAENRRPTLQTPHASHQSDSAHWSLLPLALSSPDTIPPLRPPKLALPPGFWEQNGLWISLTGLAALGALFLLWRVVSRKTAPTIPPPATTARAALQALDPALDDAARLAAVSGILRYYFIAVWGLPQAELTNTELCQALATHQNVQPELHHAVTELLDAMEHQRFSARTPAPAVVERALALIDQTEQALLPLPSSQAAA